MRIFYIRHHKTGLPVGCVATKKDKNLDIILFGVSSYNPSDKFDKAEARKQAAERLESSPRPVKMIPRFVRHSILSELVTLNKQGYKPVSHTVAEEANRMLQWEGANIFWKQWDVKYNRGDRGGRG